MKHLLTKIGLLTATFALWIVACDQQEILPIGDPFDKVEGLADTWKLTSIQQVDELNGSNEEALDVSSFLVGSQAATISFMADGSYTINPGSSKMYVPSEGSWAFDQNDYPSTIELSNGSNNFSIQLVTAAPVKEKPDNRLIYKYVRPIGNCAIIEKAGAVGYIYEFERQ